MIETNNDFAKSLQIELLEKEKEIIRLNSILKEARDYIKEAIISESTEFYGLIDGEHVLTILDKENKNGIN